MQNIQNWMSMKIDLYDRIWILFYHYKTVFFQADTWDWNIIQMFLIKTSDGAEPMPGTWDWLTWRRVSNGKTARDEASRHTTTTTTTTPTSTLSVGDPAREAWWLHAGN